VIERADIAGLARARKRATGAPLVGVTAFCRFSWSARDSQSSVNHAPPSCGMIRGSVGSMICSSSCQAAFNAAP
jgi:hypothetical protein